MPERGPAPRRRCGSSRAMAGLPWKWPRTRLPVGASALGVFVLCWLYVFPVYRLPDEKEIVQGVLLQQGKAWRRNQTAVALFRKLLEECCDPGQLFAMTKMNSPMGKNLWFDGEFLYSVTIDNATYSLFPQATPFQLPLKKCSVVGNGGILKKSGCGKQIDQADFVMRCNLPPLSSEYSKDVGSKTQLVTANPSIIQKRCRGAQQVTNFLSKKFSSGVEWQDPEHPAFLGASDIHQGCVSFTITEQPQHRRTFNILLLFLSVFLDVAGSAKFHSTVCPSSHFAP